jgi:hypothetical protein
MKDEKVEGKKRGVVKEVGEKEVGEAQYYVEGMVSMVSTT